MLTISPSQESNRKSWLSWLAAWLALTLALSLWQAQEVSGQNATQIKNGKEIGVGTTTRTIHEMETWLADKLIESKDEAIAFDQIRPKRLPSLSIKIIDNLIDGCDKGTISTGTTKWAIFYILCQVEKSPILWTYIQSKIKAGWYTEQYLKDMIAACTLSAGLVTIKE